jgi:hypothetical protein
MNAIVSRTPNDEDEDSDDERAATTAAPDRAMNAVLGRAREVATLAHVRAAVTETDKSKGRGAQGRGAQGKGAQGRGAHDKSAE